VVTSEVLSQYSNIKKEIDELQQKIKRLENEIDKIEQGEMVIDTVSGGNGGTQHYKIEGVPLPEYSRKKTLLYSRKTTLQLLEDDLLEKTNAVEEFIASVDDSRMRRIINLRFLEGKTWQQIATIIGGNTEGSVKMAFQRFIEKN
jgi:DNA-directed RNA polymerase specialized sigma subunit